jgi:hypothetical protein
MAHPSARRNRHRLPPSAVGFLAAIATLAAGVAGYGDRPDMFQLVCLGIAGGLTGGLAFREAQSDSTLRVKKNALLMAIAKST